MLAVVDEPKSSSGVMSYVRPDPGVVTLCPCTHLMSKVEPRKDGRLYSAVAAV